MSPATRTGSTRLGSCSMRIERLVLVALLLLGAALRIFHLGYRSLSTDEANVYWMARGSSAEIIRQNAAGNSAPPLYALALSPLAERGASEAVLRAPSCAASIAALPVVYLLARQYMPVSGALFALLLAAIAPAQVFYAQFLREYSLAFFSAAGVLLAFGRFQRRVTWWTWSALTAAIVLAIFVQYGLALLVLALNVIFALELWAAGERTRRLGGWTAAQLVALAAAWRVYDQTLRHQLRPGGFGADYLAAGYWDGSLRSLMRLTLGNTFELFGFAYPSVPLLQALVVMGAIALWRTPAGRRAVLLLVVPVLVTLAAAGLRLYPYLGARQSMMLTVMLYVSAGAGFTLLRRIDWRGVGTAAVLAWMTAEGLYGSYRQLMSTEPQHMRPIAAQLAADYRSGDRIYVYHDAATPLLYYYGDQQAHWVRGLPSPHDAEPHRRQLQDALAQPGRVWFVFSHCRAGECELIRRHAATLRPLKRIASDVGASLYLAEAAR